MKKRNAVNAPDTGYVVDTDPGSVSGSPGGVRWKDIPEETCKVEYKEQSDGI